MGPKFQRLRSAPVQPFFSAQGPSEARELGGSSAPQLPGLPRGFAGACAEPAEAGTPEPALAGSVSSGQVAAAKTTQVQPRQPKELAPEFESFVADHWQGINAAIRKVVSRYRVVGADGDDLQSELWLYLLADRGRVIARFQGQSSLDTYLFRILFRAAARWKRKQNLRVRAEVSLEAQPPEVPVQTTIPVCGTFGRRSDQQLRRVLLSLRPHDRRFLLMRLKGLSYEEIARSSGRPIRSVQTAVTQARRMLRERLGRAGCS